MADRRVCIYSCYCAEATKLPKYIIICTDRERMNEKGAVSESDFPWRDYRVQPWKTANLSRRIRMKDGRNNPPHPKQFWFHSFFAPRANFESNLSFLYGIHKTNCSFVVSVLQRPLPSRNEKSISVPRKITHPLATRPNYIKLELYFIISQQNHVFPLSVSTFSP
jgi:hypothetical protein